MKPASASIGLVGRAEDLDLSVDYVDVFNSAITTNSKLESEERLD